MKDKFTPGQGAQFAEDTFIEKTCVEISSIFSDLGNVKFLPRAIQKIKILSPSQRIAVIDYLY